ncbi:prepilin-type N-terminal cleavage/methylation domain-containing protein [Flavobacterium jejuense]|uniref:Prepilin-type N-terminal cleavage/methylation domain-containing protein n=1 Tax=Flavobacterium jejuense TaxID=1544455 RepID=A0ABX0IX02_9FLAO|nr:prepilin-type N-terminal cleavage/methylation domain-containing protein [Flavobacterium jejuense]NHN27978.1 prepilin-type N-terminal cleavage/methylation domain-containing protein [Flavobacterium jejuense]
MKNSNYIKAFSIVEVMVSMVITAIIVGLIFGVFTIVSEQILAFKKENEQTADFNRLSYSLNKAVFDSEKMMVRENGVYFQTYDGDTVFYQKEETYFIRKAQNFTDTFKIQINEIRMDSLFNSKKSKVFQKLELQLVINKNIIPLRFYKPIYANQLILWKE